MGQFAFYKDNFKVDIEELHNQINSGDIQSSNNKYSITWFDKILNKYGWWERLVDLGIKRHWFKFYLEYAYKVFKWKDINFFDFYYVLNLYRARFEEKTNLIEDRENFLKSWQETFNFFLTLHYIIKTAKSPMEWELYKDFLKDLKEGNILEYGASLAPITTSMLQNGKTNYKYFAADIRNFPFHYAKFRLKQYGVKFYDIEPYVTPKLEESYDVIFIMTVYEHLPDPFEVTKNLVRKLKPGGYYIFDYIRSLNVEETDTRAGFEQRSDVLKYLQEHLEFVAGNNIDFDKSMGVTVMRKI